MNDQLPSAGTDDLAHSHLISPYRVPGRGQIDKVDAGDEQYKKSYRGGDKDGGWISRRLGLSSQLGSEMYSFDILEKIGVFGAPVVFPVQVFQVQYLFSEARDIGMGGQFEIGVKVGPSE